MSSSRAERASLVALIAVCLFPLVRAGDVSFINDEPLLLAAALDANARGTLAPMGLLGTFGLSYGPLPTWMYQALLLITQDLVAMARIHVVVLMAPTAAALWWLSRSLRLPLWFAALPLLSPYTWFYARVLWDNTLLIPLGAAALAGYAAHLASGSRAGLRVATAAMLAMPLVHLMALALVVPLAAHMAIVRGRELWRDRLSIASIAGLFAAAAWPYWRYLITARPPASSDPSLAGWIFPLLGGRLFSARQLAYFFGDATVSGDLLAASATISWLAYILVWIGLAIAVGHAVKGARTGIWTARAHLALILCGAVIAQMVMDGVTAKFQHPHYENVNWIAFALAAWLAIDAIASVRSPLRWVAPAAGGALAVALLTAVVTISSRLHKSGGTRDVYGATLANQQQIARGLETYRQDVPVGCTVGLYQMYPHALGTLRRLNPGHGDRLAREVEIGYALPDERSGVIMLRER